MLSGLACGLVVARLLVDVSLTLGILTGLFALGTTAAFGGVALRRFRVTARALATGSQIGDGRSPALAVLLLAVTCLGAVAYVLLA